MSVQNLNTFGGLNQPAYSLIDYANLFIADPFADEGDQLGGAEDVGSQQNYIHIRIQQRNGRKTLTTLQGLPKGESASGPHIYCNLISVFLEYDSKKLLKAFKKVSPKLMYQDWLSDLIGVGVRLQRYPRRR